MTGTPDSEMTGAEISDLDDEPAADEARPEPRDPGVWHRTGMDAHLEAQAAVGRLARRAGAATIRQPIWSGATMMIEIAEPAAGIRAAVALQRGVARATADCIRYAREAGQGWEEIGAALGLGPDAAERGVPLAEAAFDFAAPADGDRRRVPSFGWTAGRAGSPSTT
jgi:hypothetical protein